MVNAVTTYTMHALTLPFYFDADAVGYVVSLVHATFSFSAAESQDKKDSKEDNRVRQGQKRRTDDSSKSCVGKRA